MRRVYSWKSHRKQRMVRFSRVAVQRKRKEGVEQMTEAGLNSNISCPPFFAAKIRQDLV
jgi:hypothetical protein